MDKKLSECKNPEKRVAAKGITLSILEAREYKGLTY